MLPIFSVSQFTTCHQTFEEDVALYRRLGVDGIEVCERKLSRDPAEARDQLAVLRDSGLRVTSVQPRVHALFPDFMCPDLHDPEERAARYRQTIDLFSSAFPGQSIPLVTITGIAPGTDYRAAHAAARRIYPELADYAAGRGLRIMFEPLTPLVMNTDTFICTLNEGLKLIEDVGRPNFGLMLDVWHVWREPGLYPRLRAAAAAGHVFGVHLSDWPAGEPRNVADRLVPGDGVIDLPAMVGAIDAGGYRGAWCMEIFSHDDLPDSLWRREVAADVITRGRRAFAEIWSRRRCD